MARRGRCIAAVQHLRVLKPTRPNPCQFKSDFEMAAGTGTAGGHRGGTGGEMLLLSTVHHLHHLHHPPGQARLAPPPRHYHKTWVVGSCTGGCAPRARRQGRSRKRTTDNGQRKKKGLMGHLPARASPLRRLIRPPDALTRRGRRGSPRHLGRGQATSLFNLLQPQLQLIKTASGLRPGLVSRLPCLEVVGGRLRDD